MLSLPCSEDGAGPLYIACVNNSTSVLKMLLEEGASVNQVKKLDQAPRRRALEAILQTSGSRTNTLWVVIHGALPVFWVISPL